jgi:hypothetical protein
MPKRYHESSDEPVCARLVAGERVVSPSKELGVFRGLAVFCGSAKRSLMRVAPRASSGHDKSRRSANPRLLC